MDKNKSPDPKQLEEIKQLLHAVKKGDITKVKLLIAQKLSVDSIDSSDPYKSTALHLAAENGNAEMVTLLLNLGAEVDKRRQDDHKRTPLHLAAANNHANVVKILLDHGADMNKVGTVGMTALYRAATQNCIEVVRLLLLYGADIDKTDALLGMTALQSAIVRGNTKIVRLLIIYSCFTSYISNGIIDLLSDCIKENHVKNKVGIPLQQEYIAREVNSAIILLWENNKMDMKEKLKKHLPNGEDVDHYLYEAKEFLIECIVFRILGSLL